MVGDPIHCRLSWAEASCIHLLISSSVHMHFCIFLMYSFVFYEILFYMCVCVCVCVLCILKMIYPSHLEMKASCVISMFLQANFPGKTCNILSFM